MRSDQLPTDPLVQEKSSINPEESELEKKPSRLKGSWRVTVSLGALVAVAVCAANMGALAYVTSTFGVEDGVSTVFVGSCSEVKTITLWADLAVNVLSTLLLGASSNAAQLTDNTQL